MKEANIILGGESSGHIVFLNQSTTGDACIAALNVLAAMKIQNKKLSEFRDNIKEKPQIYLNTSIKYKKNLETLPGFHDLISSSKEKLKKDGRILVRFSGTEPIVRVFVEGDTLSIVKEEAERITHFLEQNLS